MEEALPVPLRREAGEHGLRPQRPGLATSGNGLESLTGKLVLHVEKEL